MLSIGTFFFAALWCAAPQTMSREAGLAAAYDTLPASTAGSIRIEPGRREPAPSRMCRSKSPAVPTRSKNRAAESAARSGQVSAACAFTIGGEMLPS